jgi:hypothetical protein
MFERIKERLIAIYNDWVVAVEYRMETEQYFVATVYAVGGILIALFVVGLVAHLVLALIGIFGWIIVLFAVAYLIIRDYGEKMNAVDTSDDDDNDDNDDPQFV